MLFCFKYYLCRQNNKRSLLGRKQRSQVARSFLNRYQFSCNNKVTSLFSISCILRIILPCVLRQNALQQPAIRHHFLVVADANLGEFFFKEKSKSIVNGQKRKGKALKKCRNFIVWAYFIWFLAVVFF